jgi:hypothetical protein
MHGALTKLIRQRNYFDIYSANQRSDNIEPHKQSSPQNKSLKEKIIDSNMMEPFLFAFSVSPRVQGVKKLVESTRIV